LLKRLRQRLARRDTRAPTGAELARRYPDLDPGFAPLHEACRPATMTSVERLYALYKAVEYVVSAGIAGDFAECGVWRGGSVMMMALALQHFGDAGRKLHCFDTFEGMPPAGPHDIRHDTGEAAADIYAKLAGDKDDPAWARASLDIVRGNIAGTGYPAELVSFHPGMVEDTLPADAPPRIALLRLDTDWYESTRHELVHLYPRLAPGGVLIIDDYGYFRGARQATDEYFAEAGRRILLNRIDNTGRIGVKASLETRSTSAPQDDGCS
jgi:O-methyltransferase